ncbi:MAG: hypothetical protein ACREAU_02830 [Nitrosopumilaceae archaeon]
MYQPHREFSVSALLKAAFYFKRVGLVVALLVATALVFGNDLIFPNKYLGQVLVSVSDNLFNEGGDQAQVFASELTTDKILLRVINSLNLNRAPDKPPLLQRILAQLGYKTKIKITDINLAASDLRMDVAVDRITEAAGNPTVNRTLFNVRFTSIYPNAGQVVSTIVDTYINTAGKDKIERSTSAAEFLTVELTNAKELLTVATNALEAFKKQHAAALVSADTINTNLQTARTSLAAVEGAAQEAAVRSRQLQQFLATEPLTVGGTSTVASASGGVKLKNGAGASTMLNGVTSATAAPPPPVTANPEHLRIRDSISVASAGGAAARTQAGSIRRDIQRLETLLLTSATLMDNKANLDSVVEERTEKVKALETEVNKIIRTRDTVFTSFGSNFAVVDKTPDAGVLAIRSRMPFHIAGVAGGGIAGIGISMLLGFIALNRYQVQFANEEPYQTHTTMGNIDYGNIIGSLSLQKDPNGVLSLSLIPPDTKHLTVQKTQRRQDLIQAESHLVEQMKEEHTPEYKTKPEVFSTVIMNDVNRKSIFGTFLFYVIILGGFVAIGGYVVAAYLKQLFIFI